MRLLQMSNHSQSTPESNEKQDFTGILSAAHLTMLRNESSICDEVIAARGYRTIADKNELRELGSLRPNAGLAS